jgi:AcrR family transcriptional regulator
MLPPSEQSRRTRGTRAGRSTQVVQRVLDAAVAELAASGYAGFRMDAVTSAADVNKTTVYRRWPSRSVLVSAVVERMRARLNATPLPDTGRIEDDLIAAFSRRSDVGEAVEGRAWARLLAERTHPEVGSIIGEIVAGRHAEWVSFVTRAIERGDLPKRTNPQLVLDLVRAIVDDRFRTPTGMPDSAWLALAVRTVVAGARAGTLS